MDIPFRGKHVRFKNLTGEQIRLLNHYYELSNSEPRKSTLSQPADRQGEAETYGVLMNEAEAFAAKKADPDKEPHIFQARYIGYITAAQKYRAKEAQQSEAVEPNDEEAHSLFNNNLPEIREEAEHDFQKLQSAFIITFNTAKRRRKKIEELTEYIASLPQQPQQSESCKETEEDAISRFIDKEFALTIGSKRGIGIQIANCMRNILGWYKNQNSIT
jgi:hypothetical protein